MHIVVVDDEKKQALLNQIKALYPGSERFPTCDEAMSYVTTNHWKIDLLLIDEVFKHSKPQAVYKGGVELGKAISEKYPYIPMVMCTVNAYNMDKQGEALRDSGFIDFMEWTLLRVDKVEDIITKIKIHPNFQAKLKLRMALKEKEVKQLFRTIDNRIALKNKIIEGVDTKDFSLKIGRSNYRLFDVFSGWKKLDELNTSEANQLVADTLHATNQDTVFQGKETWKKQDSNVRFQLKKYEEEDKSEVRRALDFKAVNLLIEILTAAKAFDGERNQSISKNIISDVTGTCKENDTKSYQYFIQKMIGRRAAVGYQYLFPTNEKLTLENFCRLIKTGQTGTYKTTKETSGIRIDQIDFPSSCDPGNLINTGLGLSTMSVTVGSYKEYECDTEKSRLISTSKINLDQDHIRWEEENWYRSIGKLAPRFRLFLDNFNLSSGLLNNEWETAITSCCDLEDFQKALLKVKSQQPGSYPQLLQEIWNDLSEHDSGLISPLEDLIQAKFTK